MRKLYRTPQPRAVQKFLGVRNWLRDRPQTTFHFQDRGLGRTCAKARITLNLRHHTTPTARTMRCAQNLRHHYQHSTTTFFHNLQHDQQLQQWKRGRPKGNITVESCRTKRTTQQLHTTTTHRARLHSTTHIARICATHTTYTAATQRNATSIPV